MSSTFLMHCPAGQDARFRVDINVRWTNGHRHVDMKLKKEAVKAKEKAKYGVAAEHILPRHLPAG